MSEKEQVNKVEEKGQGSSRLRRGLMRFGRFLLRTALILFLLLFLLSLIIQTAEFQNWASQKTADILSEKIGSEVSIGGFRLNFFDKLELQDVLVRDLEDDTLFYSGQLTADFKAPIFTLLKKELKLENIILRDTKLRMVRTADDSLYNLQKILAKLASNQDKSSDEIGETEIKFDVSLQNVFLQDLKFVQIDSMYGTDMDVSLGKGRIQVDRIDLEHSLFAFQRIRLIRPSVHIQQYEAAVTYVKEEEAPLIPLMFKIGSLDLDGGRFLLDNLLVEEEQYPIVNMDYHHLHIKNIYLDADNVSFHNWETTAGRINELRAETGEGFIVQNLQADSVKVNPQITYIENGRLRTEKSDINVDIRFTYPEFPAWRDFVNDILMHVESRNSRVYVKDIMNFAPELYKVDFFKNNADRFLIIDGTVNGNVNNMRTEAFKAALDSMYVKGNIHIKDATDPEKLFIEASIIDSRIYPRKLDSMIKGLKLDSSIYRLGVAKVTGDFNGTLKDFKVNTALSSRLGKGQFNLSLHLDDAIENAQYNGEVRLSNFDIGRFLNIDSVGDISLDMIVRDGRGLSLESVDAFLEGNIDSFEMRGYVYEDIEVDGRASNSRFKGNMSITDENIDANFQGLIHYSDPQKPSMNMSLDVQNIDLYTLNFSDKPFDMSFQFDGSIDSFDLYHLQANSMINELHILYKDSIKLSLDTIQVIATDEDKGVHQQELRIQSDILNATIKGDYSWIKSWGALRNYFIQSFPQLSDRWNLTKDSVVYESDLEFDIAVKNTDGFLVLFNEELDTIKDLKISGFINTYERKAKLNAYVPKIGYGDNTFHNVYLIVFSQEGLGNLVFGIDSTIINNNISVSPISVAGDLTYDTLSFNLNIANDTEKKDNFNIDGKIFPTAERYALTFDNQYVQLFNNDWDITDENFIEFGKDFLDIDSLYFRFQDKVIGLNSTGPNQLSFATQNIPISTFNKNITSDSINLYGGLSMQVDIDNIYDINHINAAILIDSFRVNEDKYGKFTIDIKDDGTGMRSKVNIKSKYKGQEFYARGFIRPKNLDDFYHLKASGKEIPFTILEYLLYDVISNTEGKVDATLSITGAINEPQVNGKARLYDAHTTFDMLGVTYYIKNAEIKVSPTYIDFSGGEIYDKYGNVAHVQGGLTHHYFQDFGADVQVSSDRFLLLNTSKEINSFYYGHCMGSAVVNIDGLFTRPDINIVAENTDNTEFYMSLFANNGVKDAGFVRFVNPGDTIDINHSENNTAPKGINLHLDLTANEKGHVKIFMDTEEGNYIEGTGVGNIILDLKRSGDISMYGTYNISSGTYHYAFNLINRTFTVQEGGYVRWSGDPLDAEMNVVAEYLTYTSPYTLIANYQLNAQDVSATPVYVTIHLRGPILHPEINFDIRLPEVQGEIRAYVDNALASLRSDQSKLDFQAVSLLTVGEFWPENKVGTGIVFSGGANTVTGFISSQVSGFLSYIVNQALSDVSFVDNVLVDVQYNLNNDITADNLNQIGAKEVQMNLRGFLFNDRVILDVGGNYVEDDALAAGSYVTGNFAIQYVLTEDRRLRVNVYSNSDHTLEGYRIKSGVGLKYQREFNSFESLFASMRSSIIKAYHEKTGRKKNKAKHKEKIDDSGVLPKKSKLE